MTTPGLPDTRSVLAVACARVGLDATGAEPIRLGENAILRLPGGVVARISRPGQAAAAAREVAVARWLAGHGVPAVEPIDVPQPVEVDGRAVTFWHELPPHRHGTPAAVAVALRALHELSIPTRPVLPPLDPFARLAQRIDAATTLSVEQRQWLHHRRVELEGRYRALPPGLPPCVVHGDAWVGNVVVTGSGDPVLVDLERFSVGPPEWDLVSTAIKHTSFAWISADDYRAFCDRYGHDVTAWPGYDLLRDIRELRMTCYLAQHATEHPDARDEAALRVASLQGRRGPRPWAWTAAT